MKVSCIVPVHDGERFLHEALESVLTQGHDDMEVIVVDDGSTDGTPEILRRFDGLVRVVRQDQGGPSAARNHGLELATGDLIAFQDADDLWTPAKLQVQLARFRDRPGLEICVGMVQNFWMPELAHEAARFQGHPFARPQPGFIFGTLVAKRAAFDRVGPLNEDLRVAEDHEWFLRAREAGVVEEVVPEVVLRRRLHRDNATRSDLASRQGLLANVKAALDRRRMSS